MSSKRPVSDSDSPSKRPKTEISDIVAQAKQRLLLKQQNQAQKKIRHDPQTTHSEPKQTQGKGGINVEIHPLLRGISAKPDLPKNHNPLKQNVRQWFDPLAINPYLNQNGGTRPAKTRQLQFNTPGKYIAEGDDLRKKLEAEARAKKEYEDKKQQGLTADENVAEHLWKHERPPKVEWWDRPYLKSNSYADYSKDEDLILDNEDAPISIYIQHPVLIAPTNEQHSVEEKALYLTKKEMKRMRKNARQEKLKDKQDRIKLGLDPPPPPKVKLANLMNVLTNEAIKDPTAVEMKVKEEIEERLQKHLQENEDRKLTKEQRLQKTQEQHDRDLQKGYFTTVYKIDRLVNPAHQYKIDINAKQLDLLGICLYNPKFNLVIVEGGRKSINFYKKLMTRRINWTENTAPKDDPDRPLEDLTSNKCEVVWEGQVKDLRFKKWSIMRSRDDDEAFEVLNRFGIENYWREAAVETSQ